jgi:hypothetical protein
MYFQRTLEDWAKLDIKQAHAAAIESYIESHIGLIDSGDCGDMYFQRTLEDWAKFDINKRTKFDASISSGLAIMACQKHLYASKTTREVKKIDFGFSKYNNSGPKSKIIQ